MAVASQSPPPSSPPPDEPRLAYRWALGRYKAARLAAIRLAQGLAPDGDRIRPAGTAEEITEHLDHPAAVEALAARLPIGSRLALSLFAVTETTSMPTAGLAHALAVAGRRAGRGDRPAARPGPAGDRAECRARPDRRFRRGDEARAARPRCSVRVHPSVPHAVRIVRPEGRPADGRRDRSCRSASRTAWSRSSGSARSGSGPAPSRCGRPSRGRCTSATASGSRTTRSWPAPIADAIGAPARPRGVLAGAGPSRRRGRARLLRPAAAGGPDRILGRQRRPPPADDRHRLAVAPDLAGAGCAHRRRRRHRVDPGRAVPAARRAPVAGHPRRCRSGSRSTTWPGTSRRGMPEWDRRT